MKHELIYSFPINPYIPAYGIGKHEWFRSTYYDRTKTVDPQKEILAKQIHRGGDHLAPIDFPIINGIETGYILTDHDMWDIDVPDDDSILAMHTFRNFFPFTSNANGARPIPEAACFQPLYLHDANLSVWLAGKDLDLKGGSCYFFVHSGGPQDDWGRYKSNFKPARWYLKSEPLILDRDGVWREYKIRLKNDPKLWQKSWGGPLTCGLSLTLGNAISFGFCFHGFPTSPYTKPTGKFMMSELKFSWDDAEPAL